MTICGTVDRSSRATWYSIPEGNLYIHFNLDQPTEQPALTRLVNRPGALQFLGFGAGVAPAAGATGLTWRAIDGGVLVSGTAPPTVGS